MNQQLDAKNPVSPLLQEQLLLGGVADAEPGHMLTASYYGNAAGEVEAFAEGAALVDASNLFAYALAGASAQALVSMLICSAVPDPGQIRPSLVLAGDGTVIAPVLVAQVEPAQFVLWAPEECTEGLEDWILGIASLEQDGSPVFGNLGAQNLTYQTPCLVLAGPSAQDVPLDYVADPSALPAAGVYKPVTLDAIATTMAHLELSGTTYYLIWCDVASARILWRSFLSFEVVQPVGTSALWGSVLANHEQLAEVLDEGAFFSPAELGLSALVRPDTTFIGARALAASQD